jgi:hypothetical protein
VSAANIDSFSNRGPVTRIKPAAPITNIVQMMEALAVGWVEGSGDNRALIAFEDPYNTRYLGYQFIRMPENRYNFDRMSPGDIPVDSGYYRLRGFIKFEARDQFRGLFEVDGADDQVWWRARLTARGAEVARAGLLLDFASLRDTQFFAPATSDIASDLVIPFATKQIGGPA